MLACPSLKIMQSRIAQQRELVLPLPESLIGLLQTLIALLVFAFQRRGCLGTGKRVACHLCLFCVLVQFGLVGSEAGLR